MDANAYVDFATLAVKAGQTPDPATGALNTPIYETTTFAYPDMATYEQKSQAALQWTPGYYFYSRSANPTTAALEQKVAALEGAEVTAVTACGMGAVNAALMSLLDAGDHCVASDDLFVVSTQSLQQLYPAKGIQVDRVDITDHRQIEAAIRPNTKVLYLEALSNPHLKLADLDALAQLAHSRGLKLVVDNTFLSPCLLRPLDHGADLVIHSGTKYLAGHGDALCGLVSGKKELVDRVRDYSDMLGSHISPFDAWLVLRGIRTLHLLEQGGEEFAANLDIIPIYIGVDGEENQGLCIGTENYWCVNGRASEEDIQATLDFMYWCATSEEGTTAMAQEMGFICPFKSAKETENVLSNRMNASVNSGKYAVSWTFNNIPSEQWKNGVGSALTTYAADQTDANWDAVVTAFVDSWATEAAAAG